MTMTMTMVKSLLMFVAFAFANNSSSSSSTKHDAHKHAPFNCDTTQFDPAADVHSLRPNDIQVIASLGDSITAGFGLDSNNVIDLITEWRGRVWTSGGQFEYEDRITVASALKKYNPALQGASTGNGGANGPNAGLNVADSGAIARGMPAQARKLITRIRSDPSYSAEDWKLINIWIGGNDLCAVCNGNAVNQPPAYINYIREAIEVLEAGLTHSFINLITIVDVSSLKVVAVGLGCVLGRTFCGCGTSNRDADIDWVVRASGQMHSMTYDLAEEFRVKLTNRDDFEVVAQPFFIGTTPPLNPDGTGDLSYFAPDCFHFSGKGHEEGAKALWLNMFEFVGAKTEGIDFSRGDALVCPEDIPGNSVGNSFLRTYKNSQRGWKPNSKNATRA